MREDAEGDRHFDRRDTDEHAARRGNALAALETGEDGPDMTEDGGASGDDLHNGEVVKGRRVLERDRTLHQPGDEHRCHQPLAISSRMTKTPAFQPSTRITLVPPALPLP